MKTAKAERDRLLARALIAEGQRDATADRYADAVVERDRLRAFVATVAEFGEYAATLHDDPTCARCHASLTIRPDCEWDDGDMCDSCLHETLGELRERARRVLRGEAP